LHGKRRHHEDRFSLAARFVSVELMRRTVDIHAIPRASSTDDCCCAQVSE
jgi:hypothetical protein